MVVRNTAPPRFGPLPLPSRLWVPLPGPPPAGEARSRPAGTLVAAGEPLTEGGAAWGHAVAPVTGRIVETARVTLTNGREALAVVLETIPGDATGGDLLDDPAPPTPQRVADALAGVRAGTAEAWVDRLARAGVWADRWTSPDLLGQLRQCVGRPVDTVVCSLLDADPAVAVNRAVATDCGTEVVAAIAAMAQLTGAARVWAVVDDAEDSGRWDGIRSAAGIAANEMRIVPVANVYPQADPALLLYTLTRRRLRPGRLPTERGVLLLDAAAAAAAGRAMLAGPTDGPAGAAMRRVPVAVYDQAGDQTHFRSVRVGTPLRDVLAQLGLPRYGLDLRGGGPLREVQLTADCIVSGGELGIYACPREPEVNPDPCVRCGWCVEGCPVRIHPAGLLEAAQQQDPSMASRYGLDACIECGVCSYVCPSHLPLLEAVRARRRGGLEAGREETRIG